MALVSSRRCSTALSPAKQLNDAVDDFQRILTDDQRTALQKIKSIPDADAVLVFTAELDYSRQDKKGRSIATRLHSVLQSVREFSAVIDTFVSSKPEIAALIWGSVKLTVQIAINFTSYYEALSNLFMGFTTHCPRFAEYQVLYPTSDRLQTALCNFHPSIIRCCKHVIETIQRSWGTQLLNALWQSFEQEFKSDISSVQWCGKEVRREIELAKAQADRQDQELRRKESEAATGHWHKVRNILSRTGSELDTIKEGQLQQDKRRAGEQRRRLLDSLSSHEYLAPFKRACKARHPGTANWVFQTAEFRRWKEATGSPWIWCSGKIGSGKTILTASAVNHVLAHKSGIGEIVVFFFPQFDDPQSLCAETVIRSIIRQSLDPVTLSEEMEADLVEMDQKPFTGLVELTVLLRKRVAQSKMLYIFIDALDEFEATERRTLLNLLVSLGSSGSGLKVFLAGRESLSGELKGKLTGIEHVSMASAQAKPDISLYIEEALQEKSDDRDLVVGDQLLILDIKQALVKHADGMFLWVTFLIDELCAQHCDDDIRDAITRLPKTLTETFSRALSRIISRQKASVAAKTFSWVAIAKRHLTLDELREAISVEIGQPYSNPGRLVNGIDQLATWCENLVHVDEELNTVQFAHQTIHKFIVDGPRNPQFTDFYFNLAAADHHAGEICVTYLNFNDFKTTLARRPQPVPVHPVVMAKLALSHHSKKPGFLLATGFSSRHRKSKTELDVVGVLASYERGNEEALRKLQQSHPFLQYASIHWISHTSRFQKDKSKMWDSWHQIVTCGHDLANRPWPEQQKFNALDSDLLVWSLQSRHYALTRLIQGCGGISEPEKLQNAWSLAAEGDIELLDVLLGGERPLQIRNATLQGASKDGHLAVVERLLIAGANVNADPAKYGRTALQAASEGGHLAVIERLLTAGANVNADPTKANGRTALQAASEGGHLAVVERLLTAGANVNADPAWYGRTALQAASEGGHLAVVERLLIAGANVNADPTRNGRTALQAASEGGHLAVVERLLIAGANVNADPAKYGRTALQAASEDGHLAVIERLLTAGANVNADPTKANGRTALQAASRGGYLAVVERLLIAGANVNAGPTRNGRTSLQAASEGGHLAVVERLLTAGANVNADSAKWYGRTALQAASEGGHLAVIERLQRELERMSS
ncbi:ankyrin repeat-containing protein [Cladorrhinum sp. PSN259]|nr:ankyrin repeat-containing protein [Cladorrhinum sp. PSN259]